MSKGKNENAKLEEKITKISDEQVVEKVETPTETPATTTDEGYVASGVALVTNSQLDKMIKNAGEDLKKQKKEIIAIPIDSLNPNESFVPVGINGYTYQIKRGEKVEVPSEVAEILRRAKPPYIV